MRETIAVLFAGQICGVEGLCRVDCDRPDGREFIAATLSIGAEPLYHHVLGLGSLPCNYITHCEMREEFSAGEHTFDLLLHSKREFGPAGEAPPAMRTARLREFEGWMERAGMVAAAGESATCHGGHRDTERVI